MTRPKGCPKLHCRKNRSEEHTSELQSHLNLVCRLLLEKKKQITDAELLLDDKRRGILDSHNIVRVGVLFHATQASRVVATFLATTGRSAQRAEHCIVYP